MAIFKTKVESALIVKKCGMKPPYPRSLLTISKHVGSRALDNRCEGF